MTTGNQQLQDHLEQGGFLGEMAGNPYGPVPLVAKGAAIVLRLCERIETERPQDLDALYGLTHAATEEFNALAFEFEDHDSEIDTVARESIAGDCFTIARAYGFQPDSEELIATRDC